WRPDLAKQLATAGMTIGSHTWSHKDLAKNPYAKDIEQAKQEIEMGVSAVHMAVGGPTAPFFRFPDCNHPRKRMPISVRVTSRSSRPILTPSISSCVSQKTWPNRR